MSHNFNSLQLERFIALEIAIENIKKYANDLSFTLETRLVAIRGEVAFIEKLPSESLIK